MYDELGLNNLLYRKTSVDATQPLKNEAEIKAMNEVASENISSGELLGDISLIDGFLQSKNFVSGSAGWKINNDGTAEFQSATIVGSITATSGAIGGWTISANDLSSGNVSINSNTERILLGLATAPLTGNGIFIGKDSSDYEFRAGDPAGNYTHFDGTNLIVNGATVSNPVLTGIQSGSEIAIQGWQQDMTFSATDYRVVAWTTGTITLLDGTTYSITGANTGNMSALTYIYLDIAVSITLLQITTTAATAVGTGKILIAVAQNNSDTTSKATYQVYGGKGGALLGVDYIAANSASTNEFISNTAQIKDAIITNAKINDLAVSKLTAGSITSKAITMAIIDTNGDVKIQCGKTDFGDTTNGFILGIDDSDSNKVKLELGDAANYLNWTSAALNIAGVITLSFGSSGITNLSDAGALATADTLDDVSDGATYGKVLLTNISAGNILLASVVEDATYKLYTTTEQTKLSGVETGATVGANWSGNLTNIPADIFYKLSNTIDDLTNGATYGKVLLTSISAGNILLAQCDNTGYSIDNVADGATYGKVLLTNISAGQIVLAQCSGDLDDIADGTSYGKVALTSISVGKIIVAGLDSGVTDLMFGSSTIKTAIEAWRHASNLTLIDGGDIYTGSVTADKITIASLSAVASLTGSIKTAATGARVEIFPDANTGIQIIDDASNDVFKCLVGGTDVGDVIIGNYTGGQGLKYDKSAGTIYYKNIAWSEVVDDDGNAPDDNATVGATFGDNISGGGSANRQIGNNGYTTLYRQDKFGDGSDGDVTISSNTTLTSDMYYNNLTVNNGYTLNTGGYRIFVKGTLTNNGTIARNGNNGGNGGNGAPYPTYNYNAPGGSAGAALADGFLIGGEDGKAGGNGGAVQSDHITGEAGVAGSAGDSVSLAMGVSGKAGGAGGRGGDYVAVTYWSTGGVGGAAGTATPPVNKIRSLPELVVFRDYTSTAPTKLTGSAGNGGGGGGAGGRGEGGANGFSGSGGGGGGSGSSGGVILICASIIINNGTINCLGGNGGNGGNGAAGSSGGDGGGGGGGGGAGSGGSGGVVVLIYQSLTNTGTISVAGGSAGSIGTGGAGAGGGTTGENGYAGNAGDTGTLIQLEC